MGDIKTFLKHTYRHFNAATVVEAAEGWARHLDGGGKMFLAMAGAMSTAELGVVLADLIRQDKVHALSLTGANLEEDLFNLVAHDRYRRIPDWRALSAADEMALKEAGLNRVTDTCIPEEEAMRRVESHMIELWAEAERKGERLYPHQYFYRLLESGKLRNNYQADPRHCWLLAAAEKNLPIFTPGWEDSSLGNMFVAAVERGFLKGFGAVKGGLETMQGLLHWYQDVQAQASVGFFQIGGGISGDFPICVVPLIQQDLHRACKYWGYFCQISDSTTSYGSYSGAVPNEKITWGKLEPQTPRFLIESDATVVFPLMAAYLLDL